MRSGCFCAGPYGIELLNLSELDVCEIEKEIESGNGLAKPGFVRVDINFYLKEF